MLAFPETNAAPWINTRTGYFTEELVTYVCMELTIPVNCVVFTINEIPEGKTRLETSSPHSLACSVVDIHYQTLLH